MNYSIIYHKEQRDTSNMGTLMIPAIPKIIQETQVVVPVVPIMVEPNITCPAGYIWDTHLDACVKITSTGTETPIPPIPQITCPEGYIWDTHLDACIKVTSTGTETDILFPDVQETISTGTIVSVRSSKTVLYIAIILGLILFTKSKK